MSCGYRPLRASDVRLLGKIIHSSTASIIPTCFIRQHKSCHSIADSLGCANVCAPCLWLTRRVNCVCNYVGSLNTDFEKRSRAASTASEYAQNCGQAGKPCHTLLKRQAIVSHISKPLSVLRHVLCRFLYSQVSSGMYFMSSKSCCMYAHMSSTFTKNRSKAVTIPLVHNSQVAVLRQRKTYLHHKVRNRVRVRRPSSLPLFWPLCTSEHHLQASHSKHAEFRCSCTPLRRWR